MWNIQVQEREKMISMEMVSWRHSTHVIIIEIIVIVIIVTIVIIVNNDSNCYVCLYFYRHYYEIMRGRECSPWKCRIGKGRGSIHTGGPRFVLALQCSFFAPLMFYVGRPGFIPSHLKFASTCVRSVLSCLEIRLVDWAYYV